MPNNPAIAERARIAELLPCPFCGGADIRDNIYIRDGIKVSCASCPAAVHAYEPSANAKAREAWNRRA